MTLVMLYIHINFKHLDFRTHSHFYRHAYIDTVCAMYSIYFYDKLSFLTPSRKVSFFFVLPPPQLQILLLVGAISWALFSQFFDVVARRS